jgi:hypothetical protein
MSYDFINYFNYLWIKTGVITKSIQQSWKIPCWMTDTQGKEYLKLENSVPTSPSSMALLLDIIHLNASIISMWHCLPYSHGVCVFQSGMDSLKEVSLYFYI